MKALVIGVMAGLFCFAGQAQTVSPLFARGYTVIPQPQKCRWALTISLLPQAGR